MISSPIRATTMNVPRRSDWMASRMVGFVDGRMRNFKFDMLEGPV